VHSSLHANTCDLLTGLHIKDSIWCVIIGSEFILVGVIYRSPQSSDANDSIFNATLANIRIYLYCYELLIMGDFNAPTIDWTNHTCSNCESSFVHQFIEASFDGYLIQHVTNPTRHILGQRPSTLDLIFTCIPDSINEVQHHSPRMLQCEQKDNHHRCNYGKANYISIRNESSLFRLGHTAL